MKNVMRINWKDLFSNFKNTSVLALAFFSFVVTSTVQAADKIKSSPVEIRYVGSMDGKPVFEINVKNPGENGTQLSIKDEYGVILYSETIKDKDYSRKVQFENLDMGDLKLTLSLRSKNVYHSQEFKISKNTRLVQDIEVAVL